MPHIMTCYVADAMHLGQKQSRGLQLDWPEMTSLADLSRGYWGLIDQIWVLPKASCHMREMAGVSELETIRIDVRTHESVIGAEGKPPVRDTA